MILQNIWKKNQIKNIIKMGKNAKEHRKRVQKRNNQIKLEQKRYEKMMNDAMTKQIEMMKQQLEDTQGNENQTTEQSQ
jgi:hypothetical protein